MVASQSLGLNLLWPTPALEKPTSWVRVPTGHLAWPPWDQPIFEGPCGGQSQSGWPALTWFILDIQQGDVIIQVGEGAVGRATPSRLWSCKQVPREMQGALAAALLVAAMEGSGQA